MVIRSLLNKCPNDSRIRSITSRFDQLSSLRAYFICFQIFPTRYVDQCLPCRLSTSRLVNLHQPSTVISVNPIEVARYIQKYPENTGASVLLTRPCDESDELAITTGWYFQSLQSLVNWKTGIAKMVCKIHEQPILTAHHKCLGREISYSHRCHRQV